MQLLVLIYLSFKSTDVAQYEISVFFSSVALISKQYGTQKKGYSVYGWFDLFLKNLFFRYLESWVKEGPE